MKKLVLAVLFIFVLTGAALAGSVEIKGKNVFDLENCIAIALINHPDLSAEKANVNSVTAVIKQNASGLNPSINISSSYDNSDGDGSASAGLTLNQLLYDGGKTSSLVKVSKFNRDSEIETLERTGQTVIYDVKNAYFSLLQAQGDYEVAMETVTVYQEQLNKSQVSYEAGIVSRSDVTAAEVDLGQAKLDQTRTRSTVGVARATLLNTMGILDSPQNFSVKDMRDYKAISLTLDEAIERARSNRPDLKAKELSLKAFEEKIQYEGKGLNPELSTYGGYDWADGSGSDTDEWKIGLTLKIPVYDGGLTSAKKEEASSNLTRSEAEYNSLLQGVILGVRTVFLDIEETWENIETTELTVRQASENLDLATGRYSVGVGNSLEVSQAAENYSQTKKDHNEALYNYMISLAALDKAMGTSVKDILGEGEQL